MKKIYYLGLLLLLIGTASVKAQVTIGKEAVPHGGALLDLQQPDATTQKGMKFPVVSLSDVGQYGLTAGDKATAAGMVVYNDNPNIKDGSGKGLYVWDGGKWNRVGAPNCPPTITDVEGNSYKASSFGSAGCWMTENLRSTQNDVMEAGKITVMDSPSSSSNIMLATYPNKADKANERMGLLYTWGAAANDTSGEGQVSQGICPKGWHLPNNREWTDLEKEIAISESGVYSDGAPTIWDDAFYITNTAGDRPAIGVVGHGAKMKSKNPVTTTATGGLSKAANAGGFDALLVGFYEDGYLSEYGAGTIFWTSSPNSTGKSFFRQLSCNHSSVGLGIHVNTRVFFSVRCNLY